jgi:asparagine synthase (glutamine-hydrolysing)
LDEAARAAESVLSKAVAARMVADVSVGAFLSGGVDSSVVVALMQAQATRPVKTFSIGFTEEQFNEAHHAKAVAEHLGTDHIELYVTPADCMDVIPKLPTLYDEPFGDYSQIPTYLVSALARRDVTVALSGDGGDELFAGYNSYPPALERWSAAKGGRRRLPDPVRKIAIPRLMEFARSGQNAAESSSFLPAKLRRRMRKRLRTLENNLAPLAIGGPAEVYARHRERTGRPDELVIGAKYLPSGMTESEDWAKVEDPLLAMQHLDFITYMVDDVLVKVDRASMACSLEVRCPLLDPAVIELAWRLPPSLRLAPDGGKPVLRAVLANYVPRHLFERPKQGFGLPLELWLRGPLRDWAEELLDENRLRAAGYLRPEAIRNIWNQHLSGEHEHTFLVWSILMFQAWLEHWQAPGIAAQPLEACGAAQ